MFPKTSIQGLLSANPQIANPALPLALIGLGILAVLLVVYAKARRAKKKSNKYLIKDSTFDIEVKASEEKRDMKRKLDEYCKKEHYNYTSGYLPGYQPELSYIDPARRGAPLERISVKETYAPEMVVPKGAEEGMGSPLPTNPYSSRLPKKPAPIMTQPSLPPSPPVLTPVPDDAEFKNPQENPYAKIFPLSPLANFSATAPTTPESVTDAASFAAEPPKAEKKRNKLKNAAKADAPVEFKQKAEPSGKVDKIAKENPESKSKFAVAPVVAPIVAGGKSDRKAPPEKVEPLEEPVISTTEPVRKISEVSAEKPDLHRVTINQTPVSYKKAPSKSEPKSEYFVSEHEHEPSGAEIFLADEYENEAPDAPVVIPQAESVETVPEEKSEEVGAPLEEPVSESSEEPASEAVVAESFPTEAQSEEVPTEEICPLSSEALPEEIAEDEGMPTVEEYDVPPSPLKIEIPEKTVKKKVAPKKKTAKKAPAQSNPYFNPFANPYQQPNGNNPYQGAYPNPFAQNAYGNDFSAFQPQMPEQPSAEPASKKPDVNEESGAESNVVVIKIPDEIKAMYKFDPDEM